jgi:hypothetical protein
MSSRHSNFWWKNDAPSITDPRASLMKSHACLLRFMVSVVFATSLSLNAAGLSLSGTVTPLSGSFLYQLAIANAGPDDFAIVSIIDAPLADPLIAGSLTKPAGFLGSYDGGAGFIDFLEDTDLFAASTTKSGFSFESLAGPAGAFAAFEGLTTQGSLATGGITWAVRSVPEPAGGLISALVIGLGFVAASRATRRSSIVP